jgi:hypothetical protein
MLHRLLLRLRLEAAKRVPTVVVSVDPIVDFSKIQSVDKPLLESAMRNSVPAQRRV